MAAYLHSHCPTQGSYCRLISRPETTEPIGGYTTESVTHCSSDNRPTVIFPNTQPCHCPLTGCHFSAHTHLSTNQARCRVTLLMWSNTIITTRSRLWLQTGKITHLPALTSSFLHLQPESLTEGHWCQPVLDRMQTSASGSSPFCSLTNSIEAFLHVLPLSNPHII